MKLLRRTFLLLFVISNQQAYTQDFEFIVKQGTSSQEFLYLERPEEGVFAGNNIKTFGIGLGVQKFNKEVFGKPGHTKFRINYLQKGFRIPHQISGLVSEQLEIWAVDRYHFISFDAVPTIVLGKKNVKPYIFSGLRVDFLLHNTSENFQEFYTIWKSYEWELREHKRLTAGFLLGVGLDIKEIVMVEFEFNQDFNFTPIIRRPDFIGRNVLFSLNLNVNLSEIKNRA